MPGPTLTAQSLKIVELPNGGRVFQGNPPATGMSDAETQPTYTQSAQSPDFSHFAKSTLRLASQRLGHTDIEKKYALLAHAQRFAKQVRNETQRNLLLSHHRDAFRVNINKIKEQISALSDPNKIITLIQRELEGLENADYTECMYDKVGLQITLIKNLVITNRLPEASALIPSLKQTIDTAISEKGDLSQLVYLSDQLDMIEPYVDFYSKASLAKESAAEGNKSEAATLFQDAFAKLASLDKKSKTHPSSADIEQLIYAYRGFLEKHYGFYRTLPLELMRMSPENQTAYREAKKDWESNLTDRQLDKDIQTLSTHAALVKDTIGVRDSIYADLVIDYLDQALKRGNRDRDLKKWVLAIYEEMERNKPITENEKHILFRACLRLSASASSQKERKAYEATAKDLGGPVHFEFHGHIKQERSPQVTYRESMNFQSFIMLYSNLPGLTNALESLFEQNTDTPLDQYRYALIDDEYLGAENKTICNPDPQTVVVLGPSYSNHGHLVSAGPVVILGNSNHRHILTDNIVIGDPTYKKPLNTVLEKHSRAKEFIQGGQIVSRDDVDRSIVIKAKTNDN